MFKINQLLDRFKNLTNTEKNKKEIIVKFFAENNIPIEVQQVSFLNNTIFLKTKPIIKTEILIKKDILLSEIQKINDFKFIKNIK